ncbi:hypothetical protein GN956_G27159, partial [Arapaima gigas]
MAELIAARLTAQEAHIHELSLEVQLLLDGLQDERGEHGWLVRSPELERLKIENEKLRYQIVHLKRGLLEESRARKPEQEQWGTSRERTSKCPQREQDEEEKDKGNLQSQ